MSRLFAGFFGKAGPWIGSGQRTSEHRTSGQRTPTCSPDWFSANGVPDAGANGPVS
ncbi:MAG: hypothetical protein WCD21_25920 [Streptomyces sp.]